MLPLPLLLLHHKDINDAMTRDLCTGICILPLLGDAGVGAGAGRGESAVGDDGLVPQSRDHSRMASPPPMTQRPSPCMLEKNGIQTTATHQPNTEPAPQLPNHRPLCTQSPHA